MEGASRAVLFAKAQTGDVIFWCLVLIAGISILGIGVWILRRWAFSGQAGTATEDWSLQHLRELRKRGELTEEEFERLRRNMIAQFQATGSTRADSAGHENESGGDSRPID